MPVRIRKNERENENGSDGGVETSKTSSCPHESGT
jgi:hypothetical protein